MYIISLGHLRLHIYSCSSTTHVHTSLYFPTTLHTKVEKRTGSCQVTMQTFSFSLCTFGLIWAEMFSNEMDKENVYLLRNNAV